MKAITDPQLELPFPGAGGPETAPRAAGGAMHRYGEAKQVVAAWRPLPCPFRPGARSRAPAPATGTGARTTTASTTGAARTLTRWPPSDLGDGDADLLCVGQDPTQAACRRSTRQPLH